MSTQTVTLLVCAFFASTLAYYYGEPLVRPPKSPPGTVKYPPRKYYKYYDPKTRKYVVGYSFLNNQSNFQHEGNVRIEIKPVDINGEIRIDIPGQIPSGVVQLPGFPRPPIGPIPWPVPGKWTTQKPRPPGAITNRPTPIPQTTPSPISTYPPSTPIQWPVPTTWTPPSIVTKNVTTTTTPQWTTPLPTQNPPSTPPGNMKIVVNPNSNIIALLNQTVNIGIALDFTANIILLMNGNNGDMIIIDAKSRVGYYLNGQKSKVFWKVNLVSFEAYIQAAPPLKKFRTHAEKDGSKFALDSSNPNILKLIADMMKALGVKIGKEIKKDLSNVFEILTKLVLRLNAALRDVKSNILQQFKEKVTEVVDITLGHFVDIFESLPEVIKKIAGGITILIKFKIRLSLHLIFAVKSGIEIVQHVIDETTSAGVKVKGLTINKLFEMIASTSGPASSGYGALVRAVGLLIGVVKRTVKIDPFIDALVKLSVTTLPRNAFQLLARHLQELLRSLGRLPNTSEVKNTINDVNKLIYGKLVIGSVDVSKIIANLVEAGRQPALQLVVNTLVAIKSVVDVATSIPSLILYVLTKLSAGVGYQAVYKLFPNVKIDDDVVASGNLFKVVLKDFSFLNFVQSGFDVVKFLHKLPIIGDIMRAVGVALKISTNGVFSLFDLLKSALGYVILKKIGSVMGLPLRALKG